MVNSYILEEVLDLPDDSFKSNAKGNKFDARFDADSFIFVTDHIFDLRMLRNVQDGSLKVADPKRRPRSVRVGVGRNSRGHLTPTYRSGKIPKKPPTLDEFPTFSVGRLTLKGGMPLHVSVHLLQSRKVLKTNCPKPITRPHLEFCI